MKNEIHNSYPCSIPVAKAVLVAETTSVAKATLVVALPCPEASVASFVSVAADSSDDVKREKTDLNDWMPMERERTSQSKEEANKILKNQGFTTGLIESINRSNNLVPLRIWVVDNSESMAQADGHSLLNFFYAEEALKVMNCTRWAEIQETVTYHARMAAALQAPTSFRLLNTFNGTDMFGIAKRGPEHIASDLEDALRTIQEVSPRGTTPLSKHVREIGATVISMKDQLVAKGQKATIVLATDGLPTDQNGRSTSLARNEFTQALRSLEGLPVWVVIRLCTDDDEVVNFYNNIDNELELSLDVLDDFTTEAKKVYRYNMWLNYALPLHRLREMGFYHKLFDLIDERSLTRDELRDFFCFLYGGDVLDGLPDPHVNWDKFLKHIKTVNNKAGLQWNPIKNRMQPWVDIQKLDRMFGDKKHFSFF
jgi:hypothetical protein